MYTERPTETAGVVLWTLEADGGAAPSTVTPDGCMDLIWHGNGALVVGPDTGPHVSSLATGRKLTALRFAPGVAPAIFGLPASELRDTRVDAAQLWPGDIAQRLEDQAHRDPASGLMTFVTSRSNCETTAFDARSIADALDCGAGVADVVERSGWSERQLRRHCLAAFGYGPKMLGRILRFQRAATLVRRNVPLAIIASDLGYSDQAHMSREFTTFSGAQLTTWQTGPLRNRPDR